MTETSGLAPITVKWAALSLLYELGIIFISSFGTQEPGLWSQISEI